MEHEKIENKYKSERNEIQKTVSKNIQKYYNQPRVDTLYEIDNLALCLGSGVSADVNCAVNQNRYLWNGLVYGISEKLLKGTIIMKPYKDMVASLYIDCPDIYDKHIESLNKAIHRISIDGKFLSTDNTMECVEYLKYMAFPSKYGSTEDVYSENVLSLIVHDLFNTKRYDLSELSAADKKVFDDLVKKEVRDEKNASYLNGSYVECNGKTLIEVVELLRRLLKITKNANVLTYNYDDFLETALDYYNISKFETIYDEKTQKNAKSGQINIYHVHGYIPGQWDRKTQCGDFIFSENSYNHMADEVYRWENRVQADIFSKNRILFVGFSGVDTNFRRLMKELKKIRNEQMCANHVMFMDYGKIIKNFCTDEFFDILLMEDSGKKTFHDGLKKIISQLIFDIVSAIDVYYKGQLGIDLLWINSHGEIADYLHNVCVKKKKKSS